MDINAQIIKKWNTEGKTLEQIAQDLRLTRNIIAGRIHRLRKNGVDLRTREEQRNEASERAAARRKASKEEREREMREIEARRIERAAQREKAEELRKQVEDLRITNKIQVGERPMPNKELQCTILDLQFDSCRFIVHGERENSIYCGEKVHARHYCTLHHALCYEPAKRRPQRPFIRSRHTQRSDIRPHHNIRASELTSEF